MSAIAIVGKSGSGKSTSIGYNPDLNIKGLNPSETVLINVLSKDLPFPGWQNMYYGDIKDKGNLYESTDSDHISKAITYISNNRKEIKSIILDDIFFTMSIEFMKRAQEIGYKKFSDMAVNLTKIIEAAKNTRKDLKVFFLWHPDEDRDLGYKMKLCGKMVEDNLTPEALFTVLLYSSIVKKENGKVEYNFITNNDGRYPAKSPYGMFKELYIPNDLSIVSQAMDAYNNQTIKQIVV